MSSMFCDLSMRQEEGKEEQDIDTSPIKMTQGPAFKSRALVHPVEESMLNDMCLSRFLKDM